MFDFSSLYELMQEDNLQRWAEVLPDDIQELTANRHGKFDMWYKTYQQLPDVSANYIDLNADSITVSSQQNVDTEKLRTDLQQFHPWRKGPFELLGVNIDTEWRSDWKWQRIRKHIAPLKKRTVLDIGCGNGYHCWRMYGEGAKLVIGIDPSWLFLVQFEVVKRFVGERPVYVLPLGIEKLPAELNAFDTVFSMGVFYHRRSPLDHLMQLKGALRPGGELVLETLVIDGVEGMCLVPENRYAKMRNVWFLPSIATLQMWLRRCGFSNIRVVDITQTTIEEQRTTAWMTNESLVDYLDPNDHNLTIEGYPAPKRATFIADKE